jgi:hypothetical protein
VNADLSIHRMAFREAESLGLAQALVAKKRQDLELRLLRERVLQGAEASQAGIDAALKRMESESETVTREPDPEAETGKVVDKTA